MIIYHNLPRFPFPPDLPGFFEEFRPLFGASYGTIIPKPSWVRCVNGSPIYPDGYLVGGDWNHGILNDFPYIGNFIIPTDEVIFFRGVAQPPTRYITMDIYHDISNLPRYMFYMGMGQNLNEKGIYNTIALPSWQFVVIPGNTMWRTMVKHPPPSPLAAQQINIDPEKLILTMYVIPPMSPRWAWLNIWPFLLLWSSFFPPLLSISPYCRKFDF